MAYNNEQGSVSQDLQEGARSAANAAREAKQIAKAVGRAASGDLVGAAAEAAKSKTVRRLVAFSLAFMVFIIFCVGYLIPMTIYEGATSYAKGVVEEWRTLFYDESGTKADAGAFVRALSATGGTLKKVGLDIADVFKGLWNAIKGTKADDTDTDGATDADLGIMVDTDDLTSVFERKFNATKDKFAGRAKQISKVIEQNSGNDSALGSAVLSRYNAVANSYIKDSSYDVQYGGFSLSVTPGKLSNKAAVTLMSLESIQHSMNMSKEPLSAYIKWLGYNGNSGKTIEFPLGSNSGITYKIPAWTGGFLPQYLADEEQHYNFRKDFYTPSGSGKAAESDTSSVDVDFDQYKCSVIDMMIKVTCPDISRLTPNASESTYTVTHTDYREKEITTYTQVPTYYVKSSLSSKQIRLLTKQGWLTAYARNVVTGAQATWIYNPVYWRATSNHLVRTAATIPTVANKSTVMEEYTWEETRHMVTLSFRVPVKVKARSVNEIVKLSGMYEGYLPSEDPYGVMGGSSSGESSGSDDTSSPGSITPLEEVA